GALGDIEGEGEVPETGLGVVGDVEQRPCVICQKPPVPHTNHGSALLEVDCGQFHLVRGADRTWSEGPTGHRLGRRRRPGPGSAFRGAQPRHLCWVAGSAPLTGAADQSIRGAKFMAEFTLVAEAGRPIGSRPARRLRVDGRIPGVVYGEGVDPISVSVAARD